jgi:hypothetical protein
MSLDQELARRFVCAKCRSEGAHVKRIAATGTGLSRLFDIQHNKFIALSCANCGYTELYNARVLERKGVGMDVLDLLFGG